jgi:hypothetical protein
LSAQRYQQNYGGGGLEIAPLILMSCGGGMDGGCGDGIGMDGICDGVGSCGKFEFV